MKILLLPLLLLGSLSVVNAGFPGLQAYAIQDLLYNLNLPASLAARNCSFFSQDPSRPAGLTILCDRWERPTNITIGVIDSDPFSVGPLTTMAAIPSSLRFLNKLSSLTLQFVSVVQSYPKSIGYLTNLQSLSLNYVRLPGFLPPQLGDLIGLKTLIVKGYLTDWATYRSPYFTGTIPDSVTKLTNLVNVEFTHTQFTGRLPAFGPAHAKLRRLKVSFSHISGTIPDSYGALSALSVLELESNLLGGTLPAFLQQQTLPNLKLLLLKNNFLTGDADGYCHAPGATYNNNCFWNTSACFARMKPRQNFQLPAYLCDPFCSTGVWEGRSLPCAGHGTCVWNPRGIALRNLYYCQCDPPWTATPRDIHTCVPPKTT